MVVKISARNQPNSSTIRFFELDFICILSEWHPSCPFFLKLVCGTLRVWMAKTSDTDPLISYSWILTALDHAKLTMVGSEPETQLTS